MRGDMVRLIAALGSDVAGVGTGGAPLEVSLPQQEPARTRICRLLSDGRVRTYDIQADNRPVFAAFLDGVQESRTVAFAGGVVPLVLASVGAVVRARVEKRLVTWGDGPLVDRLICAPLTVLDPALVARLRDLAFTLTDTSTDPPATEEMHPQEFLRRAVQATQRAREGLERRWAEQWCAREHSPLYVDGGLPSSAGVLAAGVAIGVIKSHHTLYVSGGSMRTLLGLRIGERSSVLVIETGWRNPVASWYLRVRDPRGHDPMWGLVRVETSLSSLQDAATSSDARADEISRWVHAESSPLALPDARWDTMAYGIRDCEVYLRATMALN